jgi:isopropylmalate/homocitrate/citramalate synthase
MSDKIPSEKYFREGKWWVCPYNFAPEVVAARQLPNKVEIHDATLRDGEQTPGVVMNASEKIAIAEKLAEVGVERIEAGMPAVSDMDADAIKQITKLGLKSKIFAFGRAMLSDVDKAAECGCHGIVIEVPSGYPKLKYQFKWTWEEALRRSVEVIKHAKKRGLYTVYFPYDTTRAREEDLTNILTRLMQEAPPDAVAIVDTMGCALPEAIKYMVRWVSRLTKLPVEAHTHTDFGLGVATELAAIEAGATCIHSCANGLGERTGNAALEELIVALHVLYGYDKQYKIEKLPELGELIRKITGIPIAANKPVLGSRNFTRESGIGVEFVVKEPLAMFGTHPSLTGRVGEVVLGKKSGKASITYNLEKLGYDVSDDSAITEMLKQVKDKGIAKRGLLTDDEFRKIADGVIGKR